MDAVIAAGVSWTEKELAIRALEVNGVVDPNDLIDAARDKTHPCHRDFTWDINKAAQERWRDQARSLIRKCRFEVRYDEVTQPVVRYVPSPDSDLDTFTSLPKIRSQEKNSVVLLAELRMLSGLCSRVYGIALAKQNIVGAGVASQLGVIRDMVNELKEEME